MAPHNVEVCWEIADDDAMRRVVRRGTATATPDLAHSVHAEVDGLAPNRWYWYRFRVGDAESPIGRTRTMPALDSSPDQLKFAFASCQNFETGWYTAYKHMAKDELDLVFHLGDYIYEHAAKDGEVRKHTGTKSCESLTDYRLRHSQYKTDPLLQAMHRRCPWMVTWDDHEVSNDYAGGHPDSKKPDLEKFMVRRAGAYQAYYENMPLRKSSLPHGDAMQIYRSLAFGKLANFLVLDGRQYRTPQPNENEAGNINKACSAPNNTMLGEEQHAWLENSLTHSSANWNVLAQQVLMTFLDSKKGDERRYNMDHWCGYVAERNKITTLMHERKVSNPIVLTGDCHANVVSDLRTDGLRDETPIATTEFAGTSISSSGNGERAHEHEKQFKSENPNLRFFNSERGFVRCTVTPKLWTAEYLTVPFVDKPGAPLNTRATFVVESGEAGVKRA